MFLKFHGNRSVRKKSPPPWYTTFSESDLCAEPGDANPLKTICGLIVISRRQNDVVVYNPSHTRVCINQHGGSQLRTCVTIPPV